MYLNLKFFLAEGNPCESRIYIRYVRKIVDQVCQLDDLRAWVSFCRWDKDNDQMSALDALRKQMADMQKAQAEARAQQKKDAKEADRQRKEAEKAAKEALKAGKASGAEAEASGDEGSRMAR